MRIYTIVASAAAAVTLPVLAPAPAFAAPREVRAEQRECQRELRRADSRREYVQERRECRREISRAQSEYRNDYRRYGSYRYTPRYRSYGYAPVHGGYRYAPRAYHAPVRRLSYRDRIYRGYNGGYYCRRDNGTMGLITGASLGALLGQQLNIGGSAQLSALIGGAAGAVLGRSLARGELRCN